MSMWVSLSTLLTVLLSSLLVGGTTFVCDQNSTRKTGSTTYCGSENAVLCQAVQEASLTVECWTCPLGRPVNWTVTYSSGQQVELNTANHSLSLTASEMSRNAEGCYQCQCEEAGVSFGVNFSVKVAPGDKPHFSVPNGSLEGNVYELLPYPLDITLTASSIGEIVVDCSATGYPEPSYTWQVNDGDINDSCVRVEEGGKKLIFIPTPWNTKEQMTLSCTVQNGLPDGTIIGKQQLNFENVDEWLLHPHPAQSGSVVYLTDGLATGVVAACDASTFGIDYLICGNMTAVTPADNPACSVHRYVNEGKCCRCITSTCFKNLDLTMKTVEVTDSEGLGLSSIGCNFTTSTEQHLLFFARRYPSDSGSSKFPLYQLIGYTDVEKEPIPSPAPGSTLDRRLIGSNVGTLLGALVLSAVFFSIVAIVCFIVIKRRSHVTGADANLQASTKSQSRHEYCEIPRGDPERREAPEPHDDTGHGYDSDSQDRVRCIHQDFVDGVNIDPVTLAAMYTAKVVNKHQNGQIHAMHRRSEAQDVVAAYFANSVLSNWPDSIFEQQMRKLVTVLRTATDDAVNHRVADKLSRAMHFETSADFNQSCREHGTSLT